MNDTKQYSHRRTPRQARTFLQSLRDGQRANRRRQSEDERRVELLLTALSVQMEQRVRDRMGADMAAAFRRSLEVV